MTEKIIISIDHCLICIATTTKKVYIFNTEYFLEPLHSESAVCEDMWGQEFLRKGVDFDKPPVCCLSDSLTGRRDSVLLTIRPHMIRPTLVPPWLNMAERWVKAPAAENAHSRPYQFSSNAHSLYSGTLPLSHCPPLVCKFAIWARLKQENIL